jgi:hypothetical protein
VYPRRRQKAIDALELLKVPYYLTPGAPGRRLIRSEEPVSSGFDEEKRKAESWISCPAVLDCRNPGRGGVPRSTRKAAPVSLREMEQSIRATSEKHDVR